MKQLNRTAFLLYYYYYCIKRHSNTKETHIRLPYPSLYRWRLQKACRETAVLQDTESDHLWSSLCCCSQHVHTTYVHNRAQL